MASHASCPAGCHITTLSVPWPPVPLFGWLSRHLIVVGELANLTQKNEEKKAEPHMCLENSSQQKMISSVDGQNITMMMLQILLPQNGDMKK
jgi:hypothetical protein